VGAVAEEAGQNPRVRRSTGGEKPEEKRKRLPGKGEFGRQSDNIVEVAGGEE